MYIYMIVYGIATYALSSGILALDLFVRGSGASGTGKWEDLYCPECEQLMGMHAVSFTSLLEIILYISL